MYAVPTNKDEVTIDDAIKWVERAKQLGYYGGNNPRLLKTATEAIAAVLGPDEPRTVSSVLERLEQQLQSRLLNKAEGVSRESARTYVQRAGRLLRNFASWVEDPVKFTPTARRANSVARPTPKSTAMKKRPAPPKNERAIVASNTPPPNGEMREHSFQLERGTAVVRIPRAVSLEELRMISLVLATHCPDARFEWPVLRRADEDALARPNK